MLVLGYLLSPLLLVIPLMVSAVLAADAFAGEKERRTLERLLHLPITDRDLFLAKVLSAFVPALAITWVGCHRLRRRGQHRRLAGHAPGLRAFTQWMVMIVWVAPAVAAARPRAAGASCRPGPRRPRRPTSSAGR